MKRGFTIIELLVSMTIFLVVITIAVGAFISVSRMKALTSNIKESQQKMRMALEIVTRLSRQAEAVIINGDKSVELYFYLNSASHKSATRFDIANNELWMSSCPQDKIIGSTCTTAWFNKSGLFGSGVTLDSNSSVFAKNGSTIPATLDVKLYSQISGSGNQYYSDEFNIETSVALESLK